MIWNRHNRFLCEVAGAETATGGGAAGAETAVVPGAAAAAPGEGAGANAPPGGEKQEAAQPTLLQRVAAVAKDKGELLARAEKAETSARDLQGQLAAMTARAEKAEAEVARQGGELKAIEAAMAGEVAKNTTVERAAAAVVASKVGVDVAELPGKDQEGGGLAALEAKLEKETDPLEIARIAKQIDKLEAKQREAEGEEED